MLEQNIIVKIVADIIKKYQTAREFIEDSSGIEEELTRREMIIDFARENFGGQKAKLPPVDIQKFIPLPVNE